MMTRIKSIITTVYLSRPENHELHIFHCPDCKNPVIQYAGEIVKIIPGMNETKLPIVVECSNGRCKRKYNFITFLEELDNA